MTPNERLEQITSKGADLKKRRIYIHGPVDGNMTSRVLAALHVLDEQDGLITVFLNTGGGDEYEAWAMHDAMRNTRSRIMVIGLGQVMSAGAIIFNGASEALRCLTPSCRFMIHNGQGDFSEVPQPHSSVIKAMGREQEINDNRYAEMLATRAFKTCRAWAQRYQKEQEESHSRWIFPSPLCESTEMDPRLIPGWRHAQELGEKFFHIKIAQMCLNETYLDAGQAMVAGLTDFVHDMSDSGFRQEDTEMVVRARIQNGELPMPSHVQDLQEALVRCRAVLKKKKEK